MFTAEGIIIDTEHETDALSADQRALSEIPMDLGIAIKSTKLKDFEPILKNEFTRLGIELDDR